MFKLSVITDEVSQSLQTALKFAKKYKLHGVELRSVEGKDPFEYTKADVLKIKSEADAFGIGICSLAAPLFKCDYYNEKEVAAHLDGLKRCLEWANMLGAKIIRGFDFWYDGKQRLSLEERAEKYYTASDIIKSSDVKIAVEYDPSVNSVNCREASELVDFIGRDNVGVLYDPGNDVYAPRHEIPYPDGYEYAKNSLFHIHIKDAICKDGKVIAAPVGEGSVDYKGLFSKLKEIKYNGFISLETHYKPNAAIDDKVLRQPKGDAISYMGEEASSICMENLIKIIEG